MYQYGLIEGARVELLFAIPGVPAGSLGEIALRYRHGVIVKWDNWNFKDAFTFEQATRFLRSALREETAT